MLLACMPINGETASYRRSRCLDIKNSCSNFTHDHAPRAAAAANSVAHFQTLPVKKKKEPFMRNNVPATMSPCLLPPLLERYYWESQVHQFGPQMTFPSWPNPDKLSVLLKKSPLSSRERKKRWAREGEREREWSQKANVVVTPFLSQQGKFSVL